ncbi:MAG: Do family serine endopeptidase [Flavobacteriales bacterium]|nr:Do family serine endopeptidase [Flavobacteriales bacterium]
MKRSLTYLLTGLAGGLLALGIHQGFMAPSAPVARTADPVPPVEYVSIPTAGGAVMEVPDFVEAAERTVNAVVHVTTEAMVQQRDPFAEFFWGYRAAPSVPLRGAGSGVVISDDGYIVTNNHVIEGADRIQVHLNDKRQFDAKVIGRDPSTDLALIKVDASGLPTIPYANSDDVRVGEWVLAVGNPMNLTSTVTAGIVSAKARNINLLQYDQTRDVFPIESFIQTDAAVNPGNSGGALVNASGQLVGINSAIASTTGAYSGYSFAIPANIVRKVTSDLMEFGNVQRAYIGVTIGDVDQDLAKQLDMDRIRGVYVKDITAEGAAQAAGIKAGDVILKVGSIDVNNVPQLQEQVGKFRPGDKVAVTVLREGRENVMDLVLRGREGNTAVAAREERTSSSLLGAQVVKASPEELRALKIQNGVKVKSLNGGKLRSSGIREGFIITKVDQQPIREPEDLVNALESKRGGVLIEGVYPNGMKAYYGLGL